MAIMLVPHCFDYCSFVVSFEIAKSSVFQIASATKGFFEFPYEFKMSLFIYMSGEVTRIFMRIEHCFG